MGSVLQGIGSVAQVAGAHIAAQGQINTANANAQAAVFNEGVALNNAEILTGNATRVGQAGDVQAGASELQTRAQVAGIKTNQAAAGVDVNSGSAVNVRNSAASVGMLNALTVRSNAAKQAYGMETEAANQVAQAKLDKSEAAYDVAGGNLAARATILGGAGAASSSFGNYLLQNSLNPTAGAGSLPVNGQGPAADAAWQTAYNE